MTLAQIISHWNSFWFSKQSPLPICVLRIFYGLLVLAYAAQWLPDLATFFGPHAVVSAAVMRRFEGLPRFSLLYVLPETDSIVVVLWAVLVIAALMVTLGLCTRAALITTFICVISFHHRNLAILHSGDSFVRVIGFLLIFSPAGSMLSLDRLFSGAREREQSPIVMDAWPLRLLQFQLVAVYCQTFFGKCAGSTWIDGTAVYYAARMEDFHRFSVPYVFDHMWTCQMLTWGALGIEFALWALIWIKELRYTVLVLGCLLHMGIEWSMNIPFFELTMIAAYIVFVQPRHIQMGLDMLRARVVACLSPFTYSPRPSTILPRITEKEA